MRYIRPLNRFQHLTSAGKQYRKIRLLGIDHAQFKTKLAILKMANEKDSIIRPFDYINNCHVNEFGEENIIPMSIIDDAVKRILKVKVAIGLSEDPLANKSLIDQLGSQEHRELQPHIPLMDALVAAWLPGNEGLGVIDVMFGDYGFTGKLSRTWFRTIDQLPLNVGDPHYDPLFLFGFGLTTKPFQNN